MKIFATALTIIQLTQGRLKEGRTCTKPLSGNSARAGAVNSDSDAPGPGAQTPPPDMMIQYILKGST